MPSSPTPVYKLLSADYSQIELRLAAHMADVPQLKDAFNAGADIHAITAEELFGTVDRDTRNKAKTINFAILYGISRMGHCRPAGRAEGRRQSDHRPLFRALSGHPRLSSTARWHSSASMASPRPCSGARPISSRTSARPTRRSAAAPSERRSTRRSREPAPTSSSGRWRGWTRRWPRRAGRGEDAAPGP